MKVIEKKEWHQEIECRACTSVIEIEFKDLTKPAGVDHPISWECCVCDARNVVAVNDIPKGRLVVAHRAFPRDPFEAEAEIGRAPQYSPICPAPLATAK